MTAPLHPTYAAGAQYECPFCGSANVNVVPHYFDGQSAYAGHCQLCGSFGPHMSSAATALKLWNAAFRPKGMDHVQR